MRETVDDLARLQSLLTASIERAGAYLRSSFEMPQRSLSAADLVAALNGLLTVAAATTTRAGEPRVAPTGAFLYRGAFALPTTATSARARHVAARPGLSLTYYQGNDLAVIAHGVASGITPADPDFAPLDALFQELSGGSVLAWGEGVYLRLEANTLYTYRRAPAE